MKISAVAAEREPQCSNTSFNTPTASIQGPELLIHVSDQTTAVAAGREPQCSNTSFNTPTASILRDVHNLLANWTGRGTSAGSFPAPSLPATALAAINKTKVDAAVIVGHSAGGRVAIDMVTGGSSVRAACDHS